MKARRRRSAAPGDGAEAATADGGPRRISRRTFGMAVGGLLAAGGAIDTLLGDPKIDLGDAAGDAEAAAARPADHTDHGSAGGPAAEPSSAGAEPATTSTTAGQASGTGLWSDPATWGGSVPRASDDVVVARPVVLDVDATVATLTIGSGASLTFVPDRSVALSSIGNIVVEGLLQAAPADPSVVHRIVFPSIDERRFAGGGLVPLATDVGLWVMGAGRLDLQGSPKTAWSRAAGAIGGGRAVTLEGGPSGWRPGDLLVVAPTARGDWDPSEVELASVAGPVVTAASNLGAHPAIALGDGRQATAEVVNLTRNVVLEGTPDGRPHVFVRSSSPQTIRFVECRDVGPQVSDHRNDDGELDDDGVLGRYPIHFHHSEDGSRGSLVEGVVVRRSGNRAFVPHGSHGVTFKDCVAHDVRGIAYWWDLGHESHDTVWETCVASLVKDHPETQFFGAGFLLGKGNPGSNVCRGCVAFSVNDGEAGGFVWDNPPADGLWIFEDCVAHNNRAGMGIRVWQNTGDEHVVARFVGYCCPVGISHGAYGNGYTYIDCRVTQCDLPIEMQAQSMGTGQRWIDNYVDASGGQWAAKLTDGGPVPCEVPLLIRGNRFVGYTRAALHVEPHIPDFATFWNVTGNSFSGNPLWIEPGGQARSRLTFDGIELAKPGVLPKSRPEWNASSR